MRNQVCNLNVNRSATKVKIKNKEVIGVLIKSKKKEFAFIPKVSIHMLQGKIFRAQRLSLHFEQKKIALTVAIYFR